MCRNLRSDIAKEELFVKEWERNLYKLVRLEFIYMSFEAKCSSRSSCMKLEWPFIIKVIPWWMSNAGSEYLLPSLHPPPSWSVEDCRSSMSNVFDVFRIFDPDLVSCNSIIPFLCQGMSVSGSQWLWRGKILQVSMRSWERVAVWSLGSLPRLSLFSMQSGVLWLKWYDVKMECLKCSTQ